MVSPDEGLLTVSVIVDALGATIVVVVVAGVVVAGVVGLVVVVDGAIGVVVVLLTLPGIHVSLAVAPCSPALDGSSPIATGTEMTLSAPLMLECAYANKSW